MAQPKHCPNCGVALPADHPSKTVVALTGADGEGSYDVYCPACKWSGDIAPDDEDI